jgi:hypothetical protein
VRRSGRALAGAAAIAAALIAGPAHAFKNIEGCDIVALAGSSSPVPVPAESLLSYSSAIGLLLEQQAGSAAAANWQSLASSIIGNQHALIDKIKGSQAYKDYLAGESCRVIVKLNDAAVDALLVETEKSGQGAALLRGLYKRTLMQIDRIQRAARFRSAQDLAAAQAGYYCFVAGAIMSQLPAERQQNLTLADFGDTVSCKDAGRA